MATKRTTKESPNKSGPDGDYRPVLNMEAGILTTDERCPLGLPRWQSSPNGYHHYDAREVAFAMHCLAHKFNLPEFDLWLSSLERPERDKLLAARERAMGAEYANNNDAFLRHLERMQAGWYLLRRVAFLLPLARIGRGAKQQRDAAGFSSGEQRQAERRPVWDEWQAAFDKTRAENTSLSPTRVCEIVGLQYGVTRRAIAKRVT